MASFTFHKNERLKSRKIIGKIFEEGQSFIAYPLRVAWIELKEPEAHHDFPIQFTQSVPKRRFAKAAQRNKIRRRIREAYRLNKHFIYESLSGDDISVYALVIIYVGKEELPYDQIFKATQKWMKIFLKKVKV